MDGGGFVFIAFAAVVVFFLWKKGRLGFLDGLFDKLKDFKDK